ncbi:hypothetical protein I545_3862 [Mycobacterium kansasii 662]|uniref:Uncharacterized protein n=1 Tax=Mycobacterium kansasii 662 TaxID=1299326 RepID=X7ZEC3_MYCKA|nr:hypothetical protein I545_3862 [Mycobacterium kansasii 662]
MVVDRCAAGLEIGEHVGADPGQIGLEIWQLSGVQAEILARVGADLDDVKMPQPQRLCLNPYVA